MIQRHCGWVGSQQSGKEQLELFVGRRFAQPGVRRREREECPRLDLIAFAAVDEVPQHSGAAAFDGGAYAAPLCLIRGCDYGMERPKISDSFLRKRTDESAFARPVTNV